MSGCIIKCGAITITRVAQSAERTTFTGYMDIVWSWVRSPPRVTLLAISFLHHPTRGINHLRAVIQTYLEYDSNSRLIQPLTTKFFCLANSRYFQRLTGSCSIDYRSVIRSANPRLISGGGEVLSRLLEQSDKGSRDENKLNGSHLVIRASQSNCP